MNKIIYLLIGVILSSIGLFFIIIDLNLLVINYNILDYLIYIISHISSNVFFIGIILLYFCLKKK